ncbi:hypothetical protein TruAng_010306 [Truncatella angustata]|nr:hypothetical protein TruAng_010306 [Truncatella angustata]
MVNTGRPSPACKACRAKRLKSSSSSSEEPVASTNSADCMTYKSIPTYTWYPCPGSLLHLETPVADQASCYFIANYISLKTHAPTCGLQFVWPLVKVAEQNETFNCAFEAVSMASIASRPNSGALVPLARVYYDKALRQIARTIQDKDKSTEDQSLAAIIMLIIYEVLMWEDARNSLNFHLQGAQAMIKIRGPEQKNSKLGQAMFGFIRGFIIHQYAHSPKVANGFEDMLWWALEGPVDDESKQALRRLNVETIILRKQVIDFMKNNPVRSEFPVALRIYRKAKSIDAEVARWFVDGPHLDMRRVQYWQDDVSEETIYRATAFPGKVYDFDNIFIGAKFLSLHLHRLVLAEILLQISSWIESCGVCLSSTCTERQEAIAIAQNEISEILAIVPFYTNTQSPSPFGGMQCSFPLFVVGSSTVITKNQKAFIIGKLSHLSHTTGLKVAGKFAEVLRDHASPPRDHPLC